MPLTSKDPGKNISKLHAEHAGEKKWPQKRIIAAGMEAARRAGGDVPEKRGFDLRQLFSAIDPEMFKLGNLHKVVATRMRMDGVPLVGGMDLRNAGYTLGMKLGMVRLKNRAILRGLQAVRNLRQGG